MRAKSALSASVFPGVVLAACVAATSIPIRNIPGMATFTPLLLAVVIGMFFGNLVRVPTAARAGLAFCLRVPLRWGIALLGVQVSVAEILSVGGVGLAVVLSSVVICFASVTVSGRLLRVDRKLVLLIAAGTSICGASAIVAANAVIRDRDENVAYALGVTTLLGTVVMFGYPVLGHWLSLAHWHYGLWIGASVHEVPQVVAAAFAHGQAAGDSGTVSKLARVLLLAPMALLLPTLAKSFGSDIGAGRAPVPWFVFAFISLVVAASLGIIPPDWKAAITSTTQFLLAVSLAAVGLETNFRSMTSRGWRPLLLGAIGTTVIGAWSLALIKCCL